MKQVVAVVTKKTSAWQLMGYPRALDLGEGEEFQELMVRLHHALTMYMFASENILKLSFLLTNSCIPIVFEEYLQVSRSVSHMMSNKNMYQNFSTSHDFPWFFPLILDGFPMICHGFSHDFIWCSTDFIWLFP